MWRNGEGTTIQGFADPFSVNLGGTINLKIESPATSYAIDIYRMGYYGGDGARLIASLTPNISVSQNQPACNTNTATGLVDCSNWGVSASWTVPTTLVSGVYFAHIYRTDGTSDENQIPFVVRDDASHSDILFKTDDETWEAYNDWGGYSLYSGDATDTLDRPTSLDAGPGRAGELRPAVRDAVRHPVRAGLLLLRRVPDDRVPGGERLRRHLHRPGHGCLAAGGVADRAAQGPHEGGP